MSSVQYHQDVVRRERANFAKTLNTLKKRTEFPALAGEALNLVNWRQRGTSIVVAAAAAGLAFTATSLFKRRKRRSDPSTKVKTLK